MTSSTTLNQLTYSLLQSIPNLKISDIVIPQLNEIIPNGHRESENVKYIPLILFASNETLQEGIQGQRTGVENFPLPNINLKELGIRTQKLLKQRTQSKVNSSSVTVIRPNEISAISQDQVFLKRILDSIEKNMGDEQFGVEKLADDVNMSVNNLNRKLSLQINKTAGKLIRSMRLQRAADLIRQNAAAISEIAYDTGFKSHANFTRSFTQEFGVSPTKYQKQFQ